MKLTIPVKVENLGTSVNGRLTAAEFNQIVAAVNSCDTTISNLELTHRLVVEKVDGFEETIASKANQTDFDQVAHLKKVPAIYGIFETHNVDTVSINYNARKNNGNGGSTHDAGGITLPSATPYTDTPDGPTDGNAGVMSATQATQLRDVVANHATKTELADLRTYVDAQLEAKGARTDVNYLMGEIGGKASTSDLQREASDRRLAVNNLWAAINTMNTKHDTVQNKLNAITPVLLKQREYDALVAAGTVVEGQHYAIVEDEQEGEA